MTPAHGVRMVGYVDCPGGGQAVVHGTESPIGWFAHGLKIVDIANPHAPRAVASFPPPVPEGAKRVSSNDVVVDSRGLIYPTDCRRGLREGRRMEKRERI